jgi:hypothetical protein
MARYYLRQTLPDGSEYWRSPDAPDLVRVWPVTDRHTSATRYGCQDSFLYTWELSEAAHQAALTAGLVKGPARSH